MLLKIVTREPNGVSARVEPLRMANTFDVRSNHAVEAHWLSRRFIYASQEWDSAVAEAKSALGPVLSQLKAAGFSVKVEVQFAHDVAHAIADFVSTQPTDMIAMATHGRSGIARMMKGSVAEEVMRRVAVPVVLMHPEMVA